MRSRTINGTEVIYPNSIVWNGDNTQISLSNSTYNVGAQITVKNNATGKQKELIYASELKNLTFNLNDTLRSLFTYGGCTINVMVTVYTAGYQNGSFGFNMNMLNGKTLPNRKHGSTRTVYVYDDDELASTQFLFSGYGTLTVNSTVLPVSGSGRRAFNLLPYINRSGEWWLCYKYGDKSPYDKETDTIQVLGVKEFSTSAVLSLQFDSRDTQPAVKEIRGGDVWNDSQVNLADYCIRVVREDPCDDFDFFLVRYYDTDGCLRYLGGKIDSETTNSKQKNYYRPDNSVYKNISRKHIEDFSGTLKVSYPELRRDSYWQDILLAEKIEFKNYDGEWTECSLATSKVTVKTQECDDVQIEYEIYKL